MIAVVAGSVGAVVRYWVSGAVQQRTAASFPVGTAVVNVIGALALGMVAGSSVPDLAADAVAGFLGGFTTFSTWMVETVGLGMLPRPSSRSLVNLVGMAALGVVAAAVGYAVV